MAYTRTISCAVGFVALLLCTQQAPAQQQVTNQVVSFADLFVAESQAQSTPDADGKKDKDAIVVTGTSCKP